MRDARVHSKVIPSAGPADSDESPRNAKRDGKPATERPAAQNVEAPLHRSNSDSGRKRRLQDPLPLEETPHGSDGRAISQRPFKVPEQEPVDTGASVVALNPTHVPRSGYYFQHDDRGAPFAGRNRKRRAFDGSGWNEHNVKDRPGDRYRETSPLDQARRRDDRRQASLQVVQSKAEDAWGHDKFLEAQAEELEERKKLSTNEKLAPWGAGKHADKTVAGTELSHEMKAGDAEQQRTGPDKRSERRYPDMNLARRERERYRERGEELRGRWMDTDQRSTRVQSRGGGYGRFVGGREWFGGRSDRSQRSSGNNQEAADRWTHDRFEEINHSPTSKQEEDHIAQIEALLSA